MSAHRELRLIASGRDLDGPDAKDAVQEALRHVHRADVLERDRGAVLAQDASLIQNLGVGDCEHRLPRVDVPVEQGQHAKPEHRNENDAANELEGMRPEHRRMRLVDHRSSHGLLFPLPLGRATLFCGPTAEKR